MNDQKYSTKILSDEKLSELETETKEEKPKLENYEITEDDEETKKALFSNAINPVFPHGRF